LAATATVREVKKYIQEVIEEKKKKIRKPEIVNQAYVNRIFAELEILQMVMAEIYDIGRRKDLAKKYKTTYNEKTQISK
jgi:alpha-amylase/alpha-mannosidase (GH57 family)